MTRTLNLMIIRNTYRIMNLLKKLLLVHIPKILPKRVVVKYLIFLSMSQGFLTNSDYIKSISKFDSKFSQDLYLVKMSDGILLIQNISRLSRFVRGKSYASNRLYNQYTNKTFEVEVNDLAKNKGIFLDIGANIGEFSIAAASKFKGINIVAFEPDPVAFICLQFNIESSNLANRVTIINAALSDKSGSFPFYIATENADSSFIQPKSFTEIIKVRSYRADQFMQENKIKSILFLKMDAEGFEPEILAGFGRRIDDISFFAIDVGPERDGLETVDQVKSIIESSKVRIKVFSDYGKRKFLNAYQETREA
jgi:FkbM family methyltransferase